MYKVVTVLIIIMFASCKQENTVERNNSTNVADTLSVTSKPESNSIATDSIAFIREKVAFANTAQLKQKHFEFKCDEIMKVDYFYDKDEIVKIAVDFGTIGDVYAKEMYYYHKNQLIFMYEFVEGGPACEGCIKTNEYRSYISNDKVFKYLKDAKEDTCRKCEFETSSKPYKLLSAKNQNEVKAAICR